jgi:hypothetical protein
MDFDFSKLLSQLPPGVKTELEEMQKKKDELDRADAQVREACADGDSPGWRQRTSKGALRCTGSLRRGRFAMPYM